MISDIWLGRGKGGPVIFGAWDRYGEEVLGRAVLNTNERRHHATLLAALERVPLRLKPCWKAACSMVEAVMGM